TNTSLHAFGRFCLPSSFPKERSSDPAALAALSTRLWSVDDGAGHRLPAAAAGAAAVDDAPRHFLVRGHALAAAVLCRTRLRGARARASAARTRAHRDEASIGMGHLRRT